MPDFFIVGAPKCGTSAIYRYLSEHPSIFMPRRKEPMYFNSDMTMPGAVRDAREYQALFAQAPAGTKIGEASTFYLCSEIAVREIVREYPNAKFIVLLRNPADAARSMHTHNIANWQEDTLDFEKAWNAQEERREGRMLPPHNCNPKVLQYGAMFSYSMQIERLFEVAPPSRCLVEIYEEFFANVPENYARLLDFLDVPLDNRTIFPSVNRAAYPGNVWFHRILRPNRFLSPTMERFIRRAVHSLSLHPRNALLNLNSRAQPECCPEFRAQLCDYFSSDISRVEELLNRNLKVWRQ